MKPHQYDLWAFLFIMATLLVFDACLLWTVWPR